MYLKKYKISKAAFLGNTSQQLPFYIIWFRVSPNRKYYCISETYLKPSQTSKMKLLAKVVNSSRDVFRTIISIQNVCRTSWMALFTKLMNGWKPLTFSAKSSILGILLGPENASEFTIFNYFHQKLHLRSLRGQICLCLYLVPQIWRWIKINEISKVCYEEIQKNVSFLRIAVRKILSITKKNIRWNCFFKQSCRLPDTYWEYSSEKFMDFSEQVSQETPANASFCD